MGMWIVDTIYSDNAGTPDIYIAVKPLVWSVAPEIYVNHISSAFFCSQWKSAEGLSYAASKCINYYSASCEWRQDLAEDVTGTIKLNIFYSFVTDLKNKQA